MELPWGIVSQREASRDELAEQIADFERVCATRVERTDHAVIATLDAALARLEELGDDPELLASLANLLVCWSAEVCRNEHSGTGVWTLFELVRVFLMQALTAQEPPEWVSQQDGILARCVASPQEALSVWTKVVFHERVPRNVPDFARWDDLLRTCTNSRLIGFLCYFASTSTTKSRPCNR